MRIHELTLPQNEKRRWFLSSSNAGINKQRQFLLFVVPRYRMACRAVDIFVVAAVVDFAKFEPKVG
jgi:hypothetical protein